MRSQRATIQSISYFFLLSATFLLSSVTLQAQAPSAGQADGMRSYSLKYVQAAAAANHVQSMIAPGRAQLYYDASRNQVVVRGDDQVQQVVYQILQDIDQPAEAQPVATPPAAAPPAVAPSGNTVRGYPVSLDQIPHVAAELSRRFPANLGVRIVPDTRTGQVVVIASDAIHRQIEQMFAPQQPIAATPAATAAAGSEILLQNIGWREFEAGLRRMWGNRVRITTDPSGTIASIRLPDVDGKPASMQLDRRTGRLQVTAEGSNSQAWLQVARVLDTPTNTPDGETSVVPIKRTNPAVVEDAIAKVRRAEAAAGDTTVAVPVKPQADRPRWGGDLVANIFTTQPGVADAPPVADPNNAIGDDQGTALIGNVQIEFIEGLDVFIVKGPKEDVAKVIRLIEQIEGFTDETQPEILIHILSNVNSIVLGELIEEIYDDVFGNRLTPVSVTPLDKPNALLLVGRPESMAAVMDLIDKLDQPVPPSTQLRVFKLVYMSSIDAETQIRDFYTERPGSADDVRPGLGTVPRLIADFRTNSLIVNASPRDIAEIAHLIDELDIEGAAAENQLKVFRLKNALADDLQTVLQEAITGIAPATPGGGGGGADGGTNANVTPQSSRLSILSSGPDGDQLINAGILAGVTVTSDANVNALIIRGPAASMELIGELIEQLDQLPDAEAQIKVFPLENGDATSLTVLLQQLFGQQVTAGQTASAAAFNSALSGTAASGGETSLVPIRFTFDLRTNSVIASGSSSDLEVVEVLLLRLDQADVQTRTTRVVRLKNAPATDVANAITTYLTTQRQLIQQQLQLAQAVSPFEQIEQEIIVVAEPVTNSLIVSATPRYYEKIMAVIDDLDFRQKMVMVQVVIAEVELNDGLEMGVEIGLQDSLLADKGVILGTALTPGQIANGEVMTGQIASALGVGRSSAVFGYSGLALSAANESVNVIIRALKDQGRLHILSRPQVMTLDNVEAFVQVGAKVPRVTGTTLTNTGQVNNTEDVDVGLLLTVRPRVSPDGLIIMEVGAEKSEVGPIEDGIPVAVTADGPVLSPQINTTTARTVISAQSGQTVVFAGLITKNKTTSRRGIPYLSAMPYLGPLFRYDQKSERRTELLIIMTPHILEGGEEMDQLKYLESDRMSWCLADVLQMHGDVGLSSGRGLWGEDVDDDTDTVYPDVDPSGSKKMKSGDHPSGQSASILPGDWSDPATSLTPAARPVRQSSQLSTPIPRVPSAPKPLPPIGVQSTAYPPPLYDGFQQR